MEQKPSTHNTSDLNSKIQEPEPIGSKLLYELLESTLSQRGRSLSSKEWELLREVTKESDDRRAEFHECMTRIIEAFLFQRFPKTLSNQTNLRRMSENIAKTLCGDPTSRQRLGEFLEHLRVTQSGA